MALTDKENWLRTVKMTNPQYMPYRIGITQSTWSALGAELEQVLLQHPQTWPNFKKGSYDWKRQKPNPRQDPEHDYVDAWGSVWRTTVAGNTGTVIKPALSDLSILDSYKPPQPETYCGGFHSVDWAIESKRLIKAKAEGNIAKGNLTHGFYLLRLEYLRGFENLMYDFIEEPPEFLRLVDIVQKLNKTAVQNWINAGAEVIGLPEDLGSQRGSLIGPKLFHKWVFPHYKDLYQMVHDAGCLIKFHCDGNIMDISDDICILRPDVFNLQDMVNGIENITKTFKGRCCIDLDFDRQSTLPFGTPNEIHELLEYEIKTLGSSNGGLMIHVEVRGPIPPENIDALTTSLEQLSTYWFE